MSFAFAADATPAHRGRRYLLALGIIAVATVLRAIADPLVHDQVPYFVYVAAAAVVTRFCGIDAGVLSVVVSAFAGNYFFVPPRYDIVPQAEDLDGMLLYVLVALALVWVVGRLRHAEIAVRQLQAQTMSVIEQMPVGVLVADRSGKLLFGNTAIERIFRSPFQPSATPEQFRTYRLFHPDGRVIESRDTQLARSLNGESVTDEEVHMERGDGTKAVVSISSAPVCDDRGRMTGAVVAVMDVTRQKEVEQTLRKTMAEADEGRRALAEQAEELAQANRMKDEFLSTLSHELRTPLNAIVGWSDMLRRGRVSDEGGRRAIESIYRNARAQSELINDVLDVSRIVSGKVRIEVQPMDVAPVLMSALESTRPAAEAKNIEVETDFDEVPIVFADATRLQQVFWNLLSNAVKFTPEGGRVHLSLRMLDGRIQVQVADTGIGIPAEFLPHVFERFRQRDSSSTRRHGGLGLGLGIVRHLVELHGGTVRADSAGEGQGATFTVVLPTERSRERRRRSAFMLRHSHADDAPPPDLSTNLVGVRVLSVDDDPEAREVTASVLRDCGAVVQTASGAIEALQQLASFEPTVLVIDIAMPDIDGYELLARLRALEDARSAPVPAIAFTAYARDEDRRRALASGFDMHLAKPVDTQTLVRAVASVNRLRDESSVGGRGI